MRDASVHTSTACIVLYLIFVLLATQLNLEPEQLPLRSSSLVES